jgi:hypothetical protein
VVDAGSEELDVLPFHRLQSEGAVPDGGRTVDDVDALLSALNDRDPVVGLVDRSATGLRCRTWSIAGDPPAVRALHQGYLDARVPADAIRFTPRIAEALAAVEDATARVAYLLPATTPELIRTVVEHGERLPQKSTFFWPKPRTGMAMMPLTLD